MKKETKSKAKVKKAPKMVVFYEGGLMERTVKVEDIQIPDLWKVAQIEELKGYTLGDKSVKEMIIETWHLAHNLKTALLKD